MGRFNALPWPTSVDAAMKIRGKLFHGRTVESREDDLDGGCQVLFQQLHLTASDVDRSGRRKLLTKPQKSSPQQAVRIWSFKFNLAARWQGTGLPARCIYAFQTLPGRTFVPDIAFRVSTMQCAQSASS